MADKEVERNREMIELHLNEEYALNLTEIAERFGISRQRVYQIFQDAGVKPLTKQRIAEITAEKEAELALKRQERAKLSDHGTYNRYAHYGCRCDECRKANNENHKQFLAENAGKTPPNHGVSGYNNYGCRCDVCRRAHNEYCYGYKQRWLRKQREAKNGTSKSE